MKKADAILMSDLHLRESTPECRVDNFPEALWNKIDFIADLQEEHDCPVLSGGDVFHHWKASPNLLRMCIERFPNKFHSIFGQHDLPQHSWENREKSGIAVLEAAGVLTVLPCANWGQDPTQCKSPSFTIKYVAPDQSVLERRILVWHHMIWQGKRPWPGCTDPSGHAVLKKYSKYDLVLSGDNHKSFVEEYEGRLLVNPGSLSRQSADQIDFKPRIYLYYADTNTVEAVYLPIKSGAVSRDHLEKSRDRDDRIEAFITRIGGDWKVELSFETNLQNFFKSNSILDSVKQIVYDSIDQTE